MKPRIARRAMGGKPLVLLSLLVIGASCDKSSATGPTPLPEPSPEAPNTTPAPPPAPRTDKPKILVDATRDGGVWWCCDEVNYQGRPLAEYLRLRGFDVEELRSARITRSVLAERKVVIRANEYTGYSAAEVRAYHDYVRSGGKLLLLSDYQRPRERDSLAESYGIEFRGISRGENLLDRFEPHPITQGVNRPISYGVGSGISELPPDAQILGYLSKRTYLDLNNNRIQDPKEPTGAPALGRMAFGQGEIVFCGDTNMWLWVPQPLVDDTIDWLYRPGGS